MVLIMLSVTSSQSARCAHKAVMHVYMTLGRQIVAATPQCTRIRAAPVHAMNELSAKVWTCRAAQHACEGSGVCGWRRARVTPPP